MRWYSYLTGDDWHVGIIVNGQRLDTAMDVTLYDGARDVAEKFSSAPDSVSLRMLMDAVWGSDPAGLRMKAFLFGGIPDELLDVTMHISKREIDARSGVN